LSAQNVNIGYNISNGGNKHGKHSEKTKQKISQLQKEKAKLMTKEERLLYYGKRNKNRIPSKEIIEKRKESRK